MPLDAERYETALESAVVTKVQGQPCQQSYFRTKWRGSVETKWMQGMRRICVHAERKSVGVSEM